MKPPWPELFVRDSEKKVGYSVADKSGMEDFNVI